jgi:hypothetical protein
VWQTIVAPQSASVVHEASEQYPVVVVPASAGSGAGSTTGQAAPAWHTIFGAGVGAFGTSTQVNPFPQSAVVLHSWARAGDAATRRAVKHPTERRVFVSDMATGNASAVPTAKAAIPRPLGALQSVS